MAGATTSYEILYRHYFFKYERKWLRLRRDASYIYVLLLLLKEITIRYRKCPNPNPNLIPTLTLS